MSSATPTDNSQSIAQIKAFMRDVSIEATRPNADEVKALGAIMPAGASVYLTAVPGKPVGELIDASIALRIAGLTPVPHLSARHFKDLEAVSRHLGDLAQRAAVDRIMLVGGDLAKPVGEVADVLSLIETGVLERHGVRRVGLPGFPEGHRHLSADEIEANLLTKLAALQQRGIESEIVTQFCFDEKPIFRWIEWLRTRGVHAPVRIGLAGPTSLLTWLNYARKCGVKASAEALATRSGLVKQAFKPVAPDPLIRTLAAAVSAECIDDVRPHLFAFGGLVQTAQWAMAARDGAVRLDADGGFKALTN